MRLMEGADIYQIAKNCRTSVEMASEGRGWISYWLRSLLTTVFVAFFGMAFLEALAVTKVLNLFCLWSQLPCSQCGAN